MNCTSADDRLRHQYSRVLLRRACPEKRTRARELIAGTTDGVLVWQAACEFVAATRKLAGFTPADAWDSLYDFLAVFPLVLPGAEALAIARSLHVELGVSFWDAA